MIPRDAIMIVSLSYYPAYAGIGLGQSFAFDKRNGKLIDESDVSD